MSNPLEIDAVKMAQAHQERQLTELVPLRLNRWAIWRRPVYVNLSWLHRQAKLAQEAAEMEFSKVALASELKQFQQQAAAQRTAAKGLRKWVKTIDWATSPSRKVQSHLPGIGLELSLVIAFVSLSVAHLMI